MRVDHTTAKLAYVDPNADFSKYTAILLTPLGVDNVEIVQPASQSQHDRESATGSSPTRINSGCSGTSATQWYNQLSTRGGYALVDSAADNVLQISAMLTRIAPTAPKDDNRSRPTGRNKVFHGRRGKMRVEVTFSDAETGEVLALAKDTRSGSSIWGINNSVTNAAEVRRVFNAWAMQIRAQLDRIHKKE